MRARVVLAVMQATFREHRRTPEAIFWTYGFPLVMAVVLGVAFGEKDLPKVRVAVLAGAEAGALESALEHGERLDVRVMDAAAADRELVMGNLDMVVSGSPAAPVLRLDPTRGDAETARMVVDDALQEHAGRTDPVDARIEEETRPGARYIDFLVPGLIGLNLLGAGLWGVGFTLVQMRSGNLLRRLLVTPMGRGEFLLGFMISRLVLMVPEAFLVVLFGALVFDVPFRGGFLSALALVLCSGLCFASIGILVAARPRTIEGAAGLMNLVLIPMWLCGGSFFSNDRFPEFLHGAVDALPLSVVNDALREIMLGGGGLSAVLLPCAYLLALALLFLGLSVKLFRWA